VLVVGGGFGGINAVSGLAKRDCDVMVVDRKNHHVFQPLLYQVATAALSPSDIASPIRAVFSRQTNVQTVLGEVTAVDLQARTVRIGNEAVEYDLLVLAAGVTHTYFGNDEWAPRAPGLKTIDDALEIRRRMLLAFERAEFEEDPDRRARLLTFVVVGGGPTGVEMAGALREIAAQTIPHDFRRVDTASSRIILVEGADRVLPSMSEQASHKAKRALERMGVEVHLETFVTAVDQSAVYAGEKRIPAENVIWAAGVRAVGLADSLGVEQDRQGRIAVGPDCAIPGHPDVFVVGDLAAQTSADDGTEVPGVAQGAIQMGRFVGAVVAAELREDAPTTHRGRPAFSYTDKGSMATIGRARAVADIAGRTFGGFFAWLLWSLIHVAFLIGFRNRMLVMINWMWQWVVHARGSRLITGPVGGQVGGVDAERESPGTQP
jgi:NADH dehydrogenase